MGASATELFERLQSLPPTEQEAFLTMLHRWKHEIVDHGSEERTLAPLPDFLARMREDFPDGLPGKPLSEIIDEGRGPRP